MTSQPLDEQYFKWLYGLVVNPNNKNPAHTFWKLFEQLHKKEFVWFVYNDDNRVEDGKELRYEFLSELDLIVDQHWLDMGCSFLELLIGLSRRLEFEGGGQAVVWFWHLLRILELSVYNDRLALPVDVVNDIADTVVWRTYRPDGLGGLFPLREPQQDLRKLELWYQMHAYLLEND